MAIIPSLLQSTCPFQAQGQFESRDQDDVEKSDGCKDEVGKKTPPHVFPFFSECCARAWTLMVGVCFLFVLILVHEAGHFLAARLQGIRVTQIAIGLPPNLFEFTSADGIGFTVGLLPIGGYVQFPTSESKPVCSKSDRDLLNNRHVLQQAFVICGGVIANFVLAVAAFLLYEHLHLTSCELEQQHRRAARDRLHLREGMLIKWIEPSGAFAKADLRTGDTILQVNHVVLKTRTKHEISLANVQTKCKENKSLNTIFHVQRGCELIDIVADIFVDQSGPRLGDCIQGVMMGVTTFLRIREDGYVQSFVVEPRILADGGLIQKVGTALLDPDNSVLRCITHFSFSLGLSNLLPLPILDGGQLILIIVEAAFGPFDEEVEWVKSIVWLVCGLVLCLFTIKDLTLDALSLIPKRNRLSWYALFVRLLSRCPSICAPTIPSQSESGKGQE